MRRLHPLLLFISLTGVAAQLSPELLRLLMITPKLDDPCLNKYGEPKECKPDFENIAYDRRIVASSVCGSKLERICRITPRTNGKTATESNNCETCSMRSQHNERLLTDINNPDDQTCWVSGYQEDPKSNVSLTLSLGKAYEVTYISLENCFGAAFPTALAIYKSTDFGRSWQPFQYYANDCAGFYNVPANAPRQVGAPQAFCSGLTDPARDGRLVFSTLQNRSNSYYFDTSKELQLQTEFTSRVLTREEQNWVTVTDLRVDFNQLPVGLASGSTPSPVFAVADLAMGGRCKCNGHASNCSKNERGDRQCDCRHNTMGTECEKCKPFYLDQPWRRAEPGKPNQCVACNCNMHSAECVFNQELYDLSGGQSGGVCENCLHNTDGRYCQYCREGFSRDLTKPITHRGACKKCDCHKIGSLGKACNLTSGQCTCKAGVIGLQCDRCMDGYQQSSSAVQPCVKQPDRVLVNAIPNNVMKDEPRKIFTKCKNEKRCNKQMRRVNLNKWCNSDFAIVATPLEMTREKDWLKYTVKLQIVFMKSDLMPRKRGKIDIWVPADTDNCRCPRIKANKKFFFMGYTGILNGQKRMIVDRKSVASMWKDKYQKKADMLETKAARGDCAKRRQRTARNKASRQRAIRADTPTVAPTRDSSPNYNNNEKWWLTS